MSHTPGPWSVAIINFENLKDVETIVATSVAHGNLHGFKVTQPGAISGRNEAELAGNINLIAAAPDLLAIVDRVANRGKIDEEWVQAARAAIAKAAG